MWQPNPRSVICSQHFIGNNRSNDPKSPAYIPSLFPKVYKKIITDTNQADERYKRTLNRELKTSSKPGEIETETEYGFLVENECVLKTATVSTQVGFDNCGDKNFSFSCIFEGNNVSTQACIPFSFSSHLDSITKPASSDKACGVDQGKSLSCLSCEAFHGFKSIKNEKSLKDISGISFSVFNILLKLMPNVNRSVISNENALLIFLMKLKLGLTYSSLAVFFGVHRTTVSRIFTDTLFTLSIKTKDLIFWPNKRTISTLLPEAFKKHYPNCRCIIDCTELKVEQPNTVEQRVYMYSRYKGSYTVKFLVAITPNGMISFVSKCYGGRSSDSFITNDSGFLALLESGDEVLADKGFPGIKTTNENVVIVMPPFLHNGRFSEDEVLETYNVASVRIHIERLFARLKMFGILSKLTINYLPYIDNIVHMCCVLTNMQSPIIKQEVDKCI